MIVFHGSTLEIRHPDAVHSKRFLDFGPGFYVTSFREQAERWARRKSARRGGSSVPIVNEYELDDDFAGFSVLRFAVPNDQIVLKTVRVLSEKLHFVRSYRIPQEA